ncbi:hypothetical protein JCM10914A_39410 [Paenibacillus sp. JCM 10914]|uniref:hypothetical protein n=1 Tax=Paenibacillus sp. JCM 10914 TaxID=1236974 RepID=UPI0003CCA54A|nr:hypothetical protein [Paenibacillus sp. JCM 10914]GAE04663.1 hypothetical protein JCM10914_718 [Paenibacillus sp. JCM 10914]
MTNWKAWRAVLVPAMISFILMAFIIRIPSYGYGAVTAAMPYHQKELNDDVLVDALMSLPLHLTISRADYDNGELTLDIKLNDVSNQTREVYEDVATIMSYSFEGTDNVQQLFLRVVAIDRWGGKRYMLLASSLSRAEWNSASAEALSELSGSDVPPSLAAELHLTLTKLWHKQFSGL